MPRTALILGDQLMRDNPALEGADRALLVESLAITRSPRRHRQRAHLVWSGMRHLAAELRDGGLEVEEVREAESLGAALTERGWPARASGSAEHDAEDELVCAAPLSRGGRALLERHGVRIVERNQLLTDPADFARWADGRRTTRMEDFYREQRRRYGVLLASGGPVEDAERLGERRSRTGGSAARAGDGSSGSADDRGAGEEDRDRADDGADRDETRDGDADDREHDGPVAALGAAPDGEPVGGRWNFDSENREPPKDGLTAREPYRPREDEIDEEVRADLDRLARDGELELWGEDAPRRFAVTPDEARRALDDFLDHRLAEFGPWQDAMVDGETWLFHSLLSVPLNLGVLDPLEVVREAEARYHQGEAPIASVEGFVRQVLGWREYVWGMYWWRTSWERDNALRANDDLPEAWWGQETGWRCLDTTVEGVREHGYAHHIERLMVLGMIGLTAGVKPWQLTKWFEGSFVDGAEWVMAPNSSGMILYADGGAMVTKPYAAGGAYVNRMSQHCGSCPYSPSEKHGEKACPVTALYWDFVQRHADLLQGNRRTQMAVRTWEKFDEDTQKAVRSRARRARRELREGRDAAPDDGLFADAG